MDTLVLLGAFCVLCALGVPVAYALGLGAIVGALWSDLLLEKVWLGEPPRDDVMYSDQAMESE